TGTAVNVTTLGSLSSLQIDRIDSNHPSAPASMQSGRYWTITPTGSGYTADLTLPDSLPAATVQACWYTGSAQNWICDSSASTSSIVTRSGITQLSGDWTAGDNPPS